VSQTGSGLVHGYLVPTGQPDEYKVHLEAEAAYGRHFVSWTGLSAPWNGAVIGTGPTTETNVTNPPAVLSVHALFEVDAADLDIRQDFDDLWASWNLSHIRWYKYDRNQSAILNKPNGIPDGFELYLMEYMLKHPEALPEGIEYSEILEGWLEDQARMADYLGANGVSRQGSVNTLAAYMLVGDYGSNMHARSLSAYPTLYGNPGVPIHTFKHLPQYLALDADPDGDGYTNLQEWEYIKLFEANPVAWSPRTRGAARRDAFKLPWRGTVDCDHRHDWCRHRHPGPASTRIARTRAVWPYSVIGMNAEAAEAGQRGVQSTRLLGGNTCGGGEGLRQ
jgi:hypothetical protein